MSQTQPLIATTQTATVFLSAPVRCVKMSVGYVSGKEKAAQGEWRGGRVDVIHPNANAVFQVRELDPGTLLSNVYWHFTLLSGVRYAK